MGLFKAAGRERAAAKLRRAGVVAKSGAYRVGSRLAQAYHARTPLGRAEAAHERGDSRFQIELTVDDHTMSTVEKIEAVGWRFESADYVSSETSTSTNHPDGSSEVQSSSTTTGVYLFSRAQ